MQREKIAEGIFMQWHENTSVTLVVEKNGSESLSRFVGETALQDAERAGMDIAFENMRESKAALHAITKPLVP